MTNKFILLLFIIIFFNCKKPTEQNDLNRYYKESTELISQILKREEIECSCLLEMRHKSLVELMAETTPSANNRKELMEALKITNDSIFDKQNELSKQFRIFKLGLNFNMNLLSLDQLVSIQQNIGNQSYSEVLWGKCPSGMMTISPPVFNETYDIAVIEVSSCLSGGELGIYRLINEKWEYLTHIYVWLSVN